MLRGQAKKGIIADQSNPLDALHKVRPRPPRIASVLRIDDTPEALALALANYPVAYICSAEAGLIFGAHAMNPDSVTRNMAQLNVLWDGGLLQRGRTTTQSVELEGARVTVSLQVQPEVLDAFMAKNGTLARGSGFLARFLMCQPDSTQGQRFYVPPPDTLKHLDYFNSRISDILSCPANIDEDGRLTTTFLRLSPQAMHVWTSFHDEMEEELGVGCRFFGVQDAASKAAENVARLACCFELFMHGMPADGTIRQECVIFAAAVVRWYMDQALILAGERLTPPEVRLAEALELWLAKEFKATQQPFMPLAQIIQYGPTRTAALRDAALAVLEAHGRVILSTQDGKRCALLHPQVFAELRGQV
jgi:putative DNA primase/helicase